MSVEAGVLNIIPAIAAFRADGTFEVSRVVSAVGPILELATPIPLGDYAYTKLMVMARFASPA
jgi:hypothetical protein